MDARPGARTVAVRLAIQAIRGFELLHPAGSLGYQPRRVYLQSFGQDTDDCQGRRAQAPLQEGRKRSVEVPSKCQLLLGDADAVPMLTENRAEREGIAATAIARPDAHGARSVARASFVSIRSRR